MDAIYEPLCKLTFQCTHLVPELALIVHIFDFNQTVITVYEYEAYPLTTSSTCCQVQTHAVLYRWNL
jgi:hypothetical protein